MKRLCILFLLFAFSVVKTHAQYLPFKRQAPIESERPESYPILGSHLLRQEEQKIIEYLKAHPEAVPKRNINKGSAWGFNVGDTRTWWATDLKENSEYQVQSTCRAVGVHCYIFIEDSLWETGGNGRVTQAAVDSILNSFDHETPADPNKGIYQTDVETFGDPPDVDSDPMIIILILNIRDGYTGSGSYTAGYFFTANEYPDGHPAIGDRETNHAEIFYMDANPIDLTNPDHLKFIRSVTAHEFQHMIHWKHDLDEETFINEGCSLIASFVCGYSLREQVSYANETNQYLFEWRSGEDEVDNDYSRAARWTLYLLEQFPNDYLKKLVASQSNGILGINQAFEDYTPVTSRRFLDVFEDWLVSNYLNDPSVDPKYGYTYTPLVKAVPVCTHFEPNVSTISDTVKKLGAQYIKFCGGKNLSVTFTSSSSLLSIKAIKMGSTVVEDVPINTPYNVPDFGTTYPEVTFILINKSQFYDIMYSYSATGTSSPSAIEVAYDDGQPEGYLVHSPDDTISVYFDGIEGTKLDSLRIAFRRQGTIQMGISTYTGVPRPTPLGQTLVAPFNVECNTEVSSVPYPIPYDNWVTVNLASQNVDASSDFVVWLVVGNDPHAPGVMISTEPDEGLHHSYTYLQSETNWYYLTDGAGNIYHYTIHAFLRTTTGVQQIVKGLPSRFALLQNSPNPFNPTTTIGYTLDTPQHVILKVYDTLGREVAKLVDERKEPGYHEIKFEASGMPSGVYVYHITAGKQSQTKKMTLLK